MKNLVVRKRCGLNPHTLKESIENEGSIAVDGCPDVLELENGDFAIIGVRITSDLKDRLPETVGCGADEEIVLVPRYVLANAKRDIPDYE